MTVVHRATARIKSGRGNLEKLLEVARDGTRLFPDSLVIRHYAADIGTPRNTLVFEIEFESYADFQEKWRAWNELEEVDEILDRWNALVEEMTHELWEGYNLRE